MEMRKQNHLVRTLRGLGFVGLMLVVVHASAQSGQADVITNSVADYSGVQGQNNWFYGYYEDSSGATTFTPLPMFGDIQSGATTVPDMWSSAGSLPPWILLSPTWNHPDEGQFAVRRYVTEEAGLVTIAGAFKRLSDSPSADGVGVAVFIDGEDILSRTLLDLNIFEYEFSAPVTNGSTIDFVVSPNGGPASDATRTVATIALTSVVPEPATLSLLALASVISLRRRKRR